jgi:carboxypeptidase T
MQKNVEIEKIVTYLLICLFLSAVLLPTINASQIITCTTNTQPYEYFNYQKMTELFHDLAEKHSDIMSLSSIGKTYEGRDIWLVKLSDKVDDNEPGVLLMGAHHGNEKPSFEVLIFFIQYMVENYVKENTDDDNDGDVNEDQIDGVDNDNDGLLDEDPSEDRVRNVIDNTQIYIIPMVNPDGVEYGWRKNRAPNYGPDGKSDKITSYGVDLNRNYGYRWYLPYLLPERYHLATLTNDKSWTYRGEKPFCENETRAVKEFVESHNISISLSYHDFGEFMLFPWMHTSKHVPHEALYRSIGENMSRINKYELRIYGLYGTREYIIPRYCGVPGSSENWLYGERGIIAYTIELCRTRPEKNPDRVLDACWKHVGVNLYVCERSWTVEEEKKECLKLPKKNMQHPIFKA